MKVWNIEQYFVPFYCVSFVSSCVTEILCVFGLYPWNNVIFGDV